MSLIVGITGFVVMSAVCAYLIVSQRSEVYENSTSAIKTSAALAAANLAEYINSASVSPRTFAKTASAVIRDNETPVEEKRQKLLDELQFIADADGRIDNFWAVFDRNAVDGLDELFAGAPGNAPDGAFNPWVSRGQLRTLSENRAKKFLELAKVEAAEIFTDAYLYDLLGREEHIFSLCIPVIVNGQVVGAVGRDFRISQLSEVAIKHDITGGGRLVASDGSFIVHADPNRIGAIYGDGNRDALDGIARGQDFDLIIQFQGREEYNAFVVVRFGECHRNWFYAASILTDEIFSAINQRTMQLVFIAILGSLVIALIGFVLIRLMLKDVKVLNNTIDKLSLGQINQQIQQSNSRDEIGTMKTKLYQFVEALKRTVLFANNIGQGKLEEDYQLLSDGDVLGQ